MAHTPRTTPPAPRKATKESTRKTFTLAHATSALPYVRRVVSDIVTTHSAAAAMQSALTEAPTGPERSVQQKSFEVAVERLQSLTEELHLVGAELRDHATGLVDFPSLHKGRPVYLSWKLGDEGFTTFHNPDMDDSQPISGLDEK